MSRGLRPNPAAGLLGRTSTTATPLASVPMRSRWARRGDSSATLAPAKGLRPSMMISAVEAPSGARISSTSSVRSRPWL
jgi:hypothetical protein